MLFVTWTNQTDFMHMSPFLLQNSVFLLMRREFCAIPQFRTSTQFVSPESHTTTPPQLLYTMRRSKQSSSSTGLKRRYAPSSSSNSSSASQNRNNAPSSSNSPPFYRVKILSMGDRQVGKSCLIKRYCEGKFESNYIGTIGIDFGVKKIHIQEKEMRVNFWDLSGDDHYFDIRNEFYKDTQSVMLVYDVNLRETFDHCQEWLQEAKKYHLPEHVPVVLVGNKSDMQQRQVSYQEGENYASEKGFMFYETSSLTGDYVNEMFDSLFEQVLKRQMR